METLSIRTVELSELPGGSNVLQSGYWGLLKEEFGWKAHSFIFNDRELLVLVRKVLKNYAIAYVPHGPFLSLENQKGGILKEIGLEIKKYLPHGCFTVRFDLPSGVYRTEPFQFKLEPELKKSFSDIQPPDTVILSLKEDEDVILGRMKSKTRYNIRLSFRKGITVDISGVEYLDEWYTLYEETSERDRIAIHSRDYYRKIFELSGDRSLSGDGPEILMFRAFYGEKFLAGIIVSVYGDRATYLYGASSGEYRNLMPAYALQWEAIKYAKGRGCREYDLFGIPPADDPSHPMSGLYRFKTGFGGRILHRPGCWDLPLKPVVYMVYRWVESARLIYYKKIRKR
ncbi:MAG: peptidoglycan bridge formation glycyltransferase FemA/FemB family protein [Spirochaetales bacterium]|nr:peptidoglycan bridge formation glycyltransferase FemA/FemB family protein [Spirochaetales bacterium]